jgi:hypothetical protein
MTPQNIFGPNFFFRAVMFITKWKQYVSEAANIAIYLFTI